MNTQKTPSEGTVPQWSFVNLCICVCLRNHSLKLAVPLSKFVESSRLAGSRRVLATVRTIGQKNLIALALSTSLCPHTIWWEAAKEPPQWISFCVISFPEDHQKNRNTQIQRACVSPFVRDHLSLLYAHCFIDRASSKANSPSLLHFVHQQLKRPPKIFKPFR